MVGWDVPDEISCEYVGGGGVRLKLTRASGTEAM